MVSWMESCRQGTQLIIIFFTSSNAIDFQPSPLSKPIMIAPSLNTQSLNIKFLCSYGGKILPRYPDGKLRYHGGHTRILSVHRSISFSGPYINLIFLNNFFACSEYLIYLIVDLKSQTAQGKKRYR